MRENRSSCKISSMHIPLLSFNFHKDSRLRVNISINIYRMPVITEVFTFNMFLSFFIRTIKIKYLPAGNLDHPSELFWTWYSICSSPMTGNFSQTPSKMIYSSLGCQPILTASLGCRGCIGVRVTPDPTLSDGSSSTTSTLWLNREAWDTWLVRKRQRWHWVPQTSVCLQPPIHLPHLVTVPHFLRSGFFH